MKLSGAGISQGNIASGAIDTGNPVKVGAVRNSVAPSPGDGARIDLQTDSRGNLKVALIDTGGTVGSSFQILQDTANLNGLVTLAVITPAFAYNGATFDKSRTPNVFKTATATAAGNTAIWTPAAGKKFRLMGYVVYVTEQATLAVAGNEEITFQDAAAAIGLGFSNYIPAAAVAGTTPASSGVVQIGNGYLSALANNALNINLGTALTAGELRVTVWGTEE